MIQVFQLQKTNLFSAKQVWKKEFYLSAVFKYLRIQLKQMGKDQKLTIVQ